MRFKPQTAGLRAALRKPPAKGIIAEVAQVGEYKAWALVPTSMFRFCSRMEAERLPPPWRVNHNADSYWVEDATGQRFAYVYYRDRPVVGTDSSGRVSQEMARRIAANVARLPDLLRALQMVNWRQQNPGKDGFP